MELKAQIRTVTGKKIKNYRKENKIPAVIYAKHIDKPLSIFVDKNEFLKSYAQTGKSTPLTIKGEDLNELVLIHEIDVNPVNNHLSHIDFLGVRKDQKVSAEVEIIFVGESVIEKDKLGRVAQLLNYITVTAVPLKLPKHIEVDISAISTLQDVIFVKDLKVDSAVEIDNDPEQAVATAIEFKEEVEEETSESKEGETSEAAEAAEGEDSTTK